MNLSTIIGIIALFLFSLTSISNYYTGGMHSEKFAGTGGFWYYILILLPLIVAFGVQVSKKVKDVSVRYTTVLGYFFWVLLLTCLFTMSTAGIDASNGLVLFFFLLKYTLLPMLISLISLGFGIWILKKTNLYADLRAELQLAIGLAIGWSGFVFSFAILGFFGWYNLYVFYALLAGAAVLGYRDVWDSGVRIWNAHFEIKPGETTSLVQIAWAINALLLVCLFVIITTNMVNIVRPYPIGWDDLGAYMNFPKLMAFAESTANQGIVFWQTFTGVGFLHESATQAFFLNSFGGILAILAIWAGVQYFIPKKSYIISFPLLAITIFMSLPMVIFQQAKDMKLDAGLLGISIFSLLLLFEGFRQKTRRLQIGFFILSGILM